MPALLVAVVLVYTCGNDKGTSPDTTPPADVADLGAASMGHDSVQLTWTAPGDDGSSGTASGYDIRFSITSITPANWDQSQECSGEPAPQAAGSGASFLVTGFAEGTPYFFALKVGDEVPNWSEVSNVASATTSAVTDYVFFAGWGSKGTGGGQFAYPEGIEADVDGNVYLADSGNDRIQVFAPAP